MSAVVKTTKSWTLNARKMPLLTKSPTFEQPVGEVTEKFLFRAVKTLHFACHQLRVIPAVRGVDRADEKVIGRSRCSRDICR